MAAKRRPKRRPAISDEHRENQLISLAFDLAEQQLIEGTASAQLVTHFVKLGSSRERLEQKRLDGETKLIDARIENLEASGRLESLYKDAMDAMKSYSGETPPEEEVFYD